MKLTVHVCCCRIKSGDRQDDTGEDPVSLTQLLQLGPDTSSTDDEGNTALHVLVRLTTAAQVGVMHLHMLQRWKWNNRYPKLSSMYNVYLRQCTHVCLRQSCAAVPWWIHVQRVVAQPYTLAVLQPELTLLLWTQLVQQSGV
jgi:hypothetical protein